MKKKNITIVGAGLVGTLLSIFLARRGMKVSIYEKRQDPRKVKNQLGRSINLALSERGLTALDKVGLKDKALQIAIPMYGRMIHDEKGNTNFLSYSSDNKAINSISRADINNFLIEEAEKLDVKFNFSHICTKIDFVQNTIGFRNPSQEYIKFTPELCFGADGAFSELRTEMIQHDKVNYSQEFLTHGYKELTIKSNTFTKNALHIWPRKSFMLIALPNLDGSFTATLFLELHGEESFDSLNTAENVSSFFKKNFPDAFDSIINLENSFFENPVGSLVTIKCFPWHKRVGGSLYGLLGDSAHGIVPFYGQGMNCGFEDCRLLDELIPDFNNWAQLWEEFESKRKPNTDAIAEMALYNFLEMRDFVANPEYLEKRNKDIEMKKNNPYWLTKYERVSFTNVPYKKILDTSF